MVSVAQPVNGGGFADGFAEAAPVRPRRTTNVAKANPWDSFKIYGYGTILVVLCLLFYSLYWWFTSGNTEAFLKHADELYQQQNFEGAVTSYKVFLDSADPKTKSASLARVRIVISKLFLERMNNGSDATKPHLLAKELLPTLEEETAIEDERDNIAGYLIDIAEKLAKQADVADTSEKKRKFIAVFDEHMKLVDNATFVPTSIRMSAQNRLDQIAEDRSRVMRDVMRDEALAETLTNIAAALETKETQKAFDLRRNLVRAYPQLYDQPNLLELVQKASQIQKELVKSKQPAPQVSQDELKTSALRSLVLANRVGEKLDALTGQIYYARSQGSVLALAADDGRLLWRQFVGYRNLHAPLPLGPNPEDGVLLSDSERLEIQQWDGATGKVVWRLAFGEPFAQPVIFKNAVYIATTSGKIFSIDWKTGRTRWATHLPQGTTSMPGVDTELGVVYVVGDHSNLYALGIQDGECLESYYLGHEANTVSVAPTSHLGHLFVYDNAGAEYCLVHSLRYDEKGLKLRPAQDDFRLIGNVLIQPEIVGRRLHVLTDRGQIEVFDVETTAPQEQVSKAAELPATSGTPLRSTMVADKGQMWVASDRLVRYQLQINTGNIVRDWAEFDGDSFLAAPKLMGPALITSRVMRNSDGVRVSAIDPKTRAELWRIDIGVPTALVAPGLNNKGLYAISGKAALYQLDPKEFATGSSAGPIENPGISGRAFQLGYPVSLGQNRWILSNLQNAGQFALFDPSREREKLRLVTVAMTGTRLATDPIRIGDGLVVALDNGRILHVNYQTGANLSSPYQAPVKPNEAYRWSHPVSVMQGSQFVIADNYRKLRRISAEGQVNEVHATTMEREMLGGAAALGESVLLAVRGPGTDYVYVADVNSLEKKQETSVEGKILAGPLAVEGLESLALVQLDQSRLRAVDANGAKLWEVTLPEGPIAGQPLHADGIIVVCGVNGWLMSIDANSGTIVGNGDLQQPISSTPFLFGKNLLIPGAEGDVFHAEIPKSQ